jgi:hypothetical protein
MYNIIFEYFLRNCGRILGKCAVVKPPEGLAWG